MSLGIRLLNKITLQNQGLDDVTIGYTGMSRPTFIDSGVSSCWSFTTSQYISLSLTDLLNGAISFWMKLPTNKTTWLPFSNNDDEYIMACDNGGNFYCSSGITFEAIYVDGILATRPATDGNWHHYCINGISFFDWSAFYINRHDVSSYNWLGYMCDLQIYNDRLSKKEIIELSKGLVFHLKLDTIDLYDVSGYNRTVSKCFEGALEETTDTPRYSKSLTFLKTGVKLPVLIPNGTKEFTVSCWIKPTSSGSDMCFFSNRSGHLLGVDIYVTNNNFIRFYTTIAHVTETTITTNSWNHIVCTFKEGVTKRVYINGTAVSNWDSNTGSVSNIGPSLTEACIGCENSCSITGEHFSGNISDFRIYKTALSDSEIVDLYSTGACIHSTHNVSCYEAKEPSWTEIARVTTVGTTTVNIPSNTYTHLGFFIVGGGGSGHGDFYTSDNSGKGGNGGCVNCFEVPMSATTCSVTVGAGGSLAESRQNSNNGSPSSVTYNNITYTSDGGYGGPNINTGAPVKQTNSGVGGSCRQRINTSTEHSWYSTHTALSSYDGSFTTESLGSMGEPGLRNMFDPEDTNKYGAGGSGGFNAYRYYVTQHATYGGNTGGGAGGYGANNTPQNQGKAGIFYGAGGGGAAFSSKHTYGQGGAGYQGIVIIYGSNTTPKITKTGIIQADLIGTFEYLYLPVGSYVNTKLHYNAGDSCKAETTIQYTGGSGRDLMGYSGTSFGYWGVTSAGTWEMHNSTYTNSNIKKINKIVFDYPGSPNDSGTYVIGALGSSYSTRSKQIYHVKLWKNGILERDLYPSVVNFKPGLIDIITLEFYPASNINSSVCPGIVRIANDRIQFNEIIEF